MMRIVSVELRNIKSYADPGCCIEFRPGVNLIWGENGSGKTTILEAIGFSLFGALDLDLKQFRRRGESEGEVILTLEGMDERYYKVIRKIRNAAELEIRDFETNRKLSKTREEAQKWLTQAVGVEFGGFGKTLFENVLGVSQGRMVESFLLGATGRKDIFEPILKIEGYEQTWDYLGKAQSDLAGRVAAVKTKAAKLEGQLRILPDLQKEIQTLREQIVADETAYRDLCALLVEQERAFQEMDARKKSLDQLESQVMLVAGEVESGKKAIQSAEKLRNESAEAAQVLEDSQEGYLAYQKALGELARLEAERRERDRQNQTLQSVEKRHAEISVRLEGIGKQLEEVSRAEQRIADLEPLAQQQKRLEETIQEKQQKVAAREKAQEEQRKQVEKQRGLEVQLAEMQKSLTRREMVTAELRVNQDALNQLLPILNQLNQQAVELQHSLEQENQALHQLEMEAQALKNGQRQLDEKTADLENERQTLNEIEIGLAERAALQERIERQNQAFEEEQARLTTSQNDQKNAAQQIALLQERRTLLQQVGTAECPVCKKPLEAHEAAEIEAEFTREISALDEKQSNAKIQEKESEKAIKQTRKSLKELTERRDRLPGPDSKQKKEMEIAKQDSAVRELELQVEAGKDIPTKVSAQEKQVLAVREHIRSFEEQSSEQQSVRDQLDREISAQNGELSKLPQPSEAQQIKASIEECKAEAHIQEQSALSLVNASAELQQAQGDLNKLGNPIEEQAQQRGIASKRLSLEKTQFDLQKDLRGQELQQTNLREILKSFAGLDQQIVSTTNLRDQHQPDYLLYLANQKAAEALPQRDEEFSRLIIAQELLETRLGELIHRRDIEKASFDSTQYQLLYGTVTTNHQKKTGLETRLEIQRKAAGAKQVQLDHLLHIQKDFDAANKEVTRLEKLGQVLHFVRESIRKAGPQIARRRVQAVSYSANRIFRQILLSTNVDGRADSSSDPGTLNWDNTYEVTVRRSNEDLVFKQLSGGEKMAAAIAIRIALLSQLTSNLRLLFLDEPTANMDDARRNQLSEQITRLEGLSQLFVITHDDAFEHAAHHVLQVFKHNDVSTVNIKS